MDEDTHQRGGKPPPPWSPVPPASLQDAARHEPPPWLAGIQSIVGADFVLTSLPDRWVYSRDRSPYAVFQVRKSMVPATLPSAIACPGTTAELAALLAFARARAIEVIPFGGGSGVLGDTLPVTGGLMIDLKRLNRILDLN